MRPTYGSCDLCGTFGVLVARWPASTPQDAPQDACQACADQVAFAMAEGWASALALVNVAA